MKHKQGVKKLNLGCSCIWHGVSAWMSLLGIGCTAAAGWELSSVAGTAWTTQSVKGDGQSSPMQNHHPCNIPYPHHPLLPCYMLSSSRLGHDGTWHLSWL